MSARGLVDAVLAATNVGERARALVDGDLCARLVEEFKLGPIFPLGAERPTRIALSNQGEPDRFRTHVMENWPGPRFERFFDAVPAETRRMLDTDGESAWLYLDDLQNVGEGLIGPHGLPLMFLALDLRTGRLEHGTRHTEPPRSLVSGVLAERLEHLLSLGAEGLWSIRWQKRKAVGLIWVSESRWRKNAEKTAGIAQALGSHAGADACRRAAESAGYVAYPDALEALSDGSWDFTLGFCRTL